MDGVSTELLESVKLALSVTVNAYDAEITDLIEAAIKDLENVLGKEVDPDDPLIKQAIKTYVRMSFRSPADYDRLRASYEAQRGTLRISSGYTEWEVDDDG